MTRMEVDAHRKLAEDISTAMLTCAPGHTPLEFWRAMLEAMIAVMGVIAQPGRHPHMLDNTAQALNDAAAAMRGTGARMH